MFAKPETLVMAVLAGLSCRRALSGSPSGSGAGSRRGFNPDVTYQITGGTGRFKGASGTLTLTAMLRPVLFNASNVPDFKRTLVGEAGEYLAGTRPVGEHWITRAQGNRGS